MRFKALVLAVVTGALMLALAGTALSGKTATSITGVQITHIPDDPSRSIYEGELKSKTKGCVKNRRIRIIHKGVVIAETRSSDSGDFRASGPRPPQGDHVQFEVLPKKACKGAVRDLEVN